MRVGAIFIPVLQLDESISWYSDSFGLEVIDNWGAGATLRFAHGEALVALIHVDTLSPLQFQARNDQNNVYYHFETDDMEETIEILKGKGITIHNYLDHGFMTELFIQDPSGNTIAFFCESSNSPCYQHATGKISW